MDSCQVLLDIRKLAHVTISSSAHLRPIQSLQPASVALQLAFTMVWMTIISQLGYYKILYGPQVLLQMNIAYFLPSIPLLGLSSQFDERLDQKFGMPPSSLHLQQQQYEALQMHRYLCRGSQNYTAQAPHRPGRLRFNLCSYSI